MKTFADGMVEVHHDDCLNILRAMPDASVDACVTDPPYGLADHHPRVIEAALRAWLSGDREHVPDGRGFMGREWDRFVPPPAVWDECWRVLKPGGHLLAFAAPRTADLMSMSIRLAGFEIRDSIKWIFAQGMPKGQNVGKAVDRHRDERAAILRVTAWLAAARDAAGWTNARIDALWGFSGMGGLWTTQGKAAIVPTWDQWQRLRAELGFSNEMDAEVQRLNNRKRTVDEAWTARPVVADGAVRKRDHLYGTYSGVIRDSAATTDRARIWEGWNTQLKPAHEPIIVARKSTGYYSTVENVLAYGTGAINVDGCRVEGRDRTEYGLATATRTRGATFGEPSPSADFDASKGRWPTNVVMSHVPLYAEDHDRIEIVGDACVDGCVPGCPVADLDGQSGLSVSRSAQPRTGKPGNGWRMTATGQEYDDAGGASRFFPVFRFEPKASSVERPRAADGTQHVSVKPLGLMRWLVRLVTQPGGRVVDPFAGTGPTAEACILEGFDCVLMENYPPYWPLIDARLSKPLQPALDIFGGAA